MRRSSLLILLIALFFIQPAFTKIGAAPSRQETATPNVILSAPVGGQALQGLIEIKGNTAVADFQSSSLAFSYQGDRTNTWFLINENDSPVAYDTLAQWDTTTITDGNYDLHLSVILKDGRIITTSVLGLRVRNYTAVEADTPTPPAPSATALPMTPGDVNVTIEVAIPTPELTATSTTTVTPPHPTITPLPTNPAELSQTAILTTLGRGGLVSLGIFALMGIYLGGRTFLRRPRKKSKT